HSASISVGYTQRLPTTSERYGFYLFNRMDNHDYIGNPDIKREQSMNAEISSLYARGGVVWKLSGFGYRIDNYILGQNLTGFTAKTYRAHGVRQYQNIIAVYMYDAEMSLNVVCNERISVYNSMKWLRRL